MVAIMFVDDEPHVLDGLRRMLRQWRNEWDMSFATSGGDALAKLATQAFDVVVSDMRMPGMDGAQLLSEIAARSPTTIRLILSGQHDRDALFRALAVTHGILAKPCDASLLVETITRAISLRTRLADQALRATINGLVCLPSLPQTYLDLHQELSRPEPSLAQVTTVIEADPPLTAKLLQIVNFTPFAGRTKLGSVAQAVRHLGVDLLKAVLLQHGVVTQLPAEILRVLPLASLWERSLATTALAHRIATAEGLSKHEIDTTVTAAMLHEIGALLLAVQDPPAYGAVITAARAGESRIDAEVRRFGVPSPSVGAYLLELWGLPPMVIEAVALHADRDPLGRNLPYPTLILNVAASLVSTGDQEWPGAAARNDPVERALPDLAGRVRSWTAFVSDDVGG